LPAAKAPGVIVPVVGTVLVSVVNESAVSTGFSFSSTAVPLTPPPATAVKRMTAADAPPAIAIELKIADVLNANAPNARFLEEPLELKRFFM